MKELFVQTNFIQKSLLEENYYEQNDCILEYQKLKYTTMKVFTMIQKQTWDFIGADLCFLSHNICPKTTPKTTTPATLKATINIAKAGRSLGIKH